LLFCAVPANRRRRQLEAREGPHPSEARTHHEHRCCSTAAVPPTLEPFDFLARSALHAELSQADIRHLPLKYPLRHLLSCLINLRTIAVSESEMMSHCIRRVGKLRGWSRPFQALAANLPVRGDVCDLPYATPSMQAETNTEMIPSLIEKARGTGLQPSRHLRFCQRDGVVPI
jgi:hypothetical protein